MHDDAVREMKIRNGKYELRGGDLRFLYWVDVSKHGHCVVVTAKVRISVKPRFVRIKLKIHRRHG